MFHVKPLSGQAKLSVMQFAGWLLGILILACVMVPVWLTGGIIAEKIVPYRPGESADRARGRNVISLAIQYAVVLGAIAAAYYAATGNLFWQKL